MLYTLTLLLLYQTVGELVSSGLALSIPGPVIGMVLLLLTLLAKGEKLDKKAIKKQRIDRDFAENEWS